MSTVKLKRSAVPAKIPLVADLALGEIAINSYDGRLFIKKDDGTQAIVTVVTANEAQTLINKTLTNPVISANGSIGISGQVLTSNGVATYWSTLISGGGATNLTYSANSSTVSVFSDTGTDVVVLAANSTTAGVITAIPQTFNGLKTFQNGIAVTGLSANGSFGTSGQVLASNGSVAYWASTGTIAPVAARIYRSTNQSIANGTTYIDLSWDTSGYQENGSFWSSGATTTIPETGYYQVFSEATFDGSGLIAVIVSNMQILVNGSIVISEDEKQVMVGATAGLQCIAQRYFTGGDTIKVQVKHSNASAINILTQGTHSPDIIVTKLTGAKGDPGTGAATNLTMSANGSSVTIISDTGTDAIILAANTITSGVLTISDQTLSGKKTFAGGVAVSDSLFEITDNSDPTKNIKFELSALGTGTTRTLTIPNSSGTVVLRDASQTLTSKIINISSNEIYTGFATRSAFIAWAALSTPSQGSVIDAAGFSYTFVSSNNSIGELPGWVPMGAAYPDHWKENTSPGTTDMGTAIQSAMTYSKNVNLVGKVYATSNTIAWDSGNLIGSRQDAFGSSVIRGLSANIPINKAIVAPGRSSTIQSIRFTYDTLTGTEGQDQRVAIDTRGLSSELQRGSVIDQVRFDNVGTAISDYGSGEFSVTYGTLEIGSHSYRGVDIRGENRTGSVWLNVYINPSTSYNPEGGFCLSGQGAGGFIGQLNIEHGSYRGYPVRIEGSQGLSINSLHIEGIDCSNTAFGYIGLNSSSISIESLNVLNTRMSQDNTAVIRLERAEYQPTYIAVPVGSVRSNTSNLRIGKLHLKGLASPNNTLYPTYPVEKTGVRNCVGFNVFKRDTFYTDNNWSVDVQDYVWTTYTAQAADGPYLQYPDLSYSGNIDFRQFSDRGKNIFPFDNYIVNGAFDKWLSANTTVSTNTSIEVANKWNLRSASGSITAGRVQEALGGENSFASKITVNTAGTYQSWDQDVKFPHEWLNQTLKLTFDMKALSSGRVLNQIANSLQNVGGSPIVVSSTIIDGSNTSLDATTSYKTYSFDFPANYTSNVSAYGTDMSARIQFEFNSNTAIRTPVVSIKNVKLQKITGSKFTRNPYDRLSISATDIQSVGTVGQVITSNGSMAYWATPAGGGSINGVAVTCDFGSSFTDKTQTVVTGQAWVTASSRISASVPVPSGVDPDEIYMLDFKPIISNLVNGVGFTVSLYSEPEAKGTYIVNCIGG